MTRRGDAVVVLVAVIALSVSGCSSGGVSVATSTSTSSTSAAAPTTGRHAVVTAPSSVAIPSDFALSPGSHLAAHGVSSGVRWYFFTSFDPTDGPCRQFYFDPPLSSARGPGVAFNPGGDTVCFRNALRIPGPAIPIGAATLLPNYPLVVIDTESSANRAFSVIAGQAAPGVTTVVARFPGGSEITMHPLQASVFVDVSKPQTSHPPSEVIAYWPGGHETCPFEHYAADYTCLRPRPETTGPVRNSRFGPVRVGCSDTGCATSGAQFTRCSTALQTYLRTGGPTPSNLNRALTALLGAAPHGESWTSASCQNSP